MQPLTAKELEYLTDSMSNEDLLIKQCIAAAAQAQKPEVQQLCSQLADIHMQHYGHLMQVLQQHAQVSPTTLQ
jgi:hypothetical protein